MTTLKTLDELRALYAEPTARVLRKEVAAIDHHIERFISLSPFVVVASGNNRLDTLQNILTTSQAALLFFIPGVDEMLRIHGSASLRTDAELLARFAHLSKPPKLVIEVKVRGAYMHCAKAMMRSRLWSPQSQVDRSALPSMGQIIKDHAQLEGPVETQEEMLQRYARDL
jgi:predicted pyridoxine 5'-phosphate oxidase superfamily flavin-nucleotide-binding protein